MIPALTGLSSNIPVKTTEWSRITDYWAAPYIPMVPFSLFKNCQWFEESHLFSFETFVMDLPKLRNSLNKHDLWNDSWIQIVHCLIFFWGGDAWAQLIVEASISHSHTHTISMTPLDEWSARRIPTQQTQETNIHSLNEIRSLDPSNREATELRLTPHGCRHRPFFKILPPELSFHLLKFMICHLFSKYFSTFFYVSRCPFIVSKSNLWVLWGPVPRQSAD
jgi:hypothetical protein